MSVAALLTWPPWEQAAASGWGWVWVPNMFRASMTRAMKLAIRGNRLAPPPGAPTVICLLPVRVSVETEAAVSALPVMVSLRPGVYSSIR